MKLMTIVFAFAALVFTGVSCKNEAKKRAGESATGKVGISRADWGNVSGQQVYLYTLTNSRGSVVKVTNYGGIVTSFVTKDKQGAESSIVVGFDSLEQYLQSPPYFGAIIGRYGNRIGGAKFSIGNQTYSLAANDGRNHLHGGLKGFDKVIWEVAPLTGNIASLTLSYLSKDGEEGYPGNLKANVKYTLTDNDELAIDYDVTTDKPTPVNLTNHSYFNLTGDTKETILNHKMQINGDWYTLVDDELIPTGELAPVKGTPFDFTVAATIGSRIDSVKGGYDHNWVVKKAGTGLHMIAILSDTVSGRVLEVSSTEPGLQFYTGNFLDGKFVNHTGTKINKHTALCLETQHYPDSPNKKEFPSTILQPGEQYHSQTIYRVSMMK